MDLTDDQMWWTEDLRVIPLDDLDPYHAANILAFLERDAARLQELVADGSIAGSLPDDAEDPLVWVRRQPIYRAISARYRPSGSPRRVS